MQKVNSQSWPNFQGRRDMTPISTWFKKGLLGPIYAKWHETGGQDGLEWARGRATADELRYTATMFKTQKERGKLASYNPTKEDVIGSVFEGVFERYHFSWEETEPYTYVPERRYQEWEQGFADAVREYWEKIKK
jgi:hypothetical protein